MRKGSKNTINHIERMKAMLIQCNLFSRSLNQNTNINVILPAPDSDEVLNDRNYSCYTPGMKFQVLYLLHGAYGDYSDWQRYTSIEKYAQKHKVAVVMPSVMNSFYQDMFHGQAFYTYLTEELPKIVTSYFAISSKPEDTFIAGLSMGGYGAFYLALSKPEAYHSAASLSGALDIGKVIENMRKNLIPSPFVMEDIFENPDSIEGTDQDLFALVRKQKEAGKQIPDLFMTCGTEDFLYQINRDAHQKFKDLGLPITYEEHPGIHDWDYWDKHMKRVLEWMPLKRDSIKE